MKQKKILTGEMVYNKKRRNVRQSHIFGSIINVGVKSPTLFYIKKLQLNTAYYKIMATKPI